jgi:hypothetical protein
VARGDLSRWVVRDVDPARADAAWAATRRTLAWDRRRKWAGGLAVLFGLLALAARLSAPVPEVVAVEQPVVFERPQRVTGADGAWFEVAASSRVTRQGETQLTLESGAVTVEVPEGLVWTVRLEGLQLRVFGAAHVVVQHQVAPAVLVERGAVELVDSSGVTRLEAGQSWPPRREEPPPPPPAPPEEAPPVRPEPKPVTPTVPEVRPQRDAERLYADWLSARSGQRWAELVEVSRRFLRVAPTDSRAGLVEVELGRVLMDRLGAPTDAARSFAHALQKTPDAPWAEDVLARIALAHAQSGDDTACREARGQYLERFPNGRRAEAVQAACSP